MPRFLIRTIPDSQDLVAVRDENGILWGVLPEEAFHEPTTRGEIGDALWAGEELEVELRLVQILEDVTDA